MSVPEEYERKKALLSQVQEGYLYYPMFFVDDKLANVGSAEYYEVLYAVKQALVESAS